MRWVTPMALGLLLVAQGPATWGVPQGPDVLIHNPNLESPKVLKP